MAAKLSMEKDIVFYKKAMEDEKILKGLIVLTQHDDRYDTEILVMDLDGMEGVILRDEVDYQRDWRSLVRFVGKEVYYVVVDIDEENEIIYCSRKKAQEKMEDGIIERLESGEEIEATITGIVRFGAYVEINGIYALLKNVDFSDDHVPVGDVLNTGDTIKVRLKNVSENKRITVEAVEKYELKTIMNFDAFERNQVVLGVVNGVQPWGAFVTIAPGLDALCPIPPTGEIEEGVKVRFRITQVQEDKKRVRGKILKVLQ